jgi:DNA-binding GntR family transcriptional regulator
MNSIDDDDPDDNALSSDAEALGLDIRQRPVDRAYEGIRRAILLGKLKPGDHLPEEMLAAMTGTSRTPVREALRRLAAEGLATVSNRHRFVTEFSYEEVAIIFDIRAQLESYATAVAAGKITDAELARLADIIEAIDLIEEDSEDAIERFVTLNTEFHSLIVNASGSGQLRQLIAPANALPLVLLKKFMLDQRVNIARSNQQHRDILAALTQRNSEWASAAMSGHILSTKPQPRKSDLTKQAHVRPR